MEVKAKYFLILVLSAVVLTACRAAKTKEEVGRAHFIGYGCMTCHRVGNEGGALGPDLTFIGFRKSREWLDLWLKNPPAWKKNTVMPNFFFKDNIREAIVDYLVTLKGQEFKEKPWDAAEVKSDPVKRGEVLFNRLGCVGCHGNFGKGGYPNNNVVGGLIPSLTMVADGYSKDELKDKIRKGVPQSAKADPNGETPMLHMPSWGEVLKDDELDALVEYLYSLRPAKTGEDAW